MNKLRTSAALVALAAVLALSGCGGGSDRDSGAEVGVGVAGEGSGIPLSAQQDVNGLVAYAEQVIATGTDSFSEPVLLGDATLPTSDTSEPLALQ